MSSLLKSSKTMNLSYTNVQLKATITNHHIEEDYVIYTIQMTDEQTSESWFFDSRFSEISQLNNAIINSKRVPISDLPKFPKKKHLWTTNKDPNLIIKRRNKLEKFLNHIFSHETVLFLNCVQEFIKRSKREYQIFKDHKEDIRKKTINLEKTVEKNFLDEIDSSISNSDFLQIMEKYDEYENKDNESPERSPSQFLKSYTREKSKTITPDKDLLQSPYNREKSKTITPENEVILQKQATHNNETIKNNQMKSSKEAKTREEALIKLEKLDNDKDHNNEDIINNFEHSDDQIDEELIMTSKNGKNVKKTGEKVKVVYMSPVLKIDRSSSIKKQEMMKKMPYQYPVKNSFFKNYFQGLCGSCSE